jgi:hypothetical protein
MGEQFYEVLNFTSTGDITKTVGPIILEFLLYHYVAYGYTL